tara:strand:+ start:428 stop:625 length:198 start_codon:yes stop_codon:yes gene_type:complete
MQIGDLVRYRDRYDIHNIGVGSIGLIIGEMFFHKVKQPRRTGRYYYVLFGDKQYTLPFHHLEEIK